MKYSMLGITALLLGCCTVNAGNLALVNKASEPIAQVLIAVGGQTIEFRNIGPNKTVAGSYEIKSDSHYAVDIKFQSGKRLKKEVGYVTNGANFNDEITVTDLDIEITDRKVK